MKDIDFPFDDFLFNNNAIFDGLSEQDLEILNLNMVSHNYKNGEILFRERGYPTGVYYVESGKVKKYKTDKDGKEQIFYICTKGEILGYHSLISDEKYTDTAACIESSIISFIPKDDFLKLIKQSPILSFKLLKVVSHEFNVLVNMITVLSQKTVRQRVALCLLLLRDKYKREKSNNLPVELDLSREDLSKFVGTARETLVRILYEFKDEGLIEVNGRSIILLDAGKLTKISNVY